MTKVKDKLALTRIAVACNAGLTITCLRLGSMHGCHACCMLHVHGSAHLSHIISGKLLLGILEVPEPEGIINKKMMSH
jgi:hypothetical protein